MTGISYALILALRWWQKYCKAFMVERQMNERHKLNREVYINVSSWRTNPLSLYPYGRHSQLIYHITSLKASPLMTNQ